MIQAIISKDTATMDLMIERGADLNKPGIICKSTTGNNVWTNAIGAAAFCGNDYIMKKLIKACPNGIDHPATENHEKYGVVKHEFTGVTPLMLAVASADKCLECVKLLIQAGANKTLTDCFGD